MASRRAKGKKSGVKVGDLGARTEPKGGAHSGPFDVSVFGVKRTGAPTAFYDNPGDGSGERSR